MATGFFPVNNQGGYDWNGKTQQFHFDAGHATIAAVGDLVRISGTAFTDGTAEVDTSAAAQLITGVIASFPPNFSDLETTHLAALTAGYVNVITDKNVIFKAEIAGGTIAVTDVGSNAEITATAATTTGNLTSSNMVINAGSFGSATAQIRILGLIPDAAGDLGLAAGSTVLCRINESTLDAVGV